MSGATRSAIAPAMWRRLKAQPAAPHSRRASVVRRKLVIADVLGLMAAFGVLQLWLGNATGTDRVGLDRELLLFVCSLPVWIVLARAMGLYNRDEERPEHTTVDDLVGVFQLVTTGVWLNFVAAYVTGSRPRSREVDHLLGARDRVRRGRAVGRAVLRPPQPRVRPERRHRRYRPHRPDHRAQAAAAPGVPHQRRRLRRRDAARAPPGRRPASRHR